MYWQFTTEVAAQRRQAFTAAADRRRSFGRRSRAAAATSDQTVDADTVSRARPVTLPVGSDDRLGDGVPAPSPVGACVA